MVTFDRSRTRELLSNQLLLLKTLAHLPPGVALTWRLRSVPIADESTVFASLALVCEVANLASVNAESITELENAASVALAAGWGLSRQREPREDRVRTRRVLLPEHIEFGLPVKPDWAMLVDLIRHRRTPITIDVSCVSTGRVVDTADVAAPSFGDPSAFDFDPGVMFLANLTPANDRLGLSLVVTVGGPHAVDSSLLQLVGQSVLGVSTRAVTPKQAGQEIRAVYAPEIALRAWHAPYARLQSRGVLSGHRTIPASMDLSKAEGASIGTAQLEGPDWSRPSTVRIPEEERLRHIYIVGKTGAGKTNLMKQIAEQDIRAGHGLAVISPHADLIDHLLDTAGKRAKDVVLLDFGDPEYVPVLNPLTLDTHSQVDYATTVVRVIDIFARRTFNQFTGPVFSDAVRLALETVAVLAPKTGRFPTIAAAIEIVKSDRLQRWASRTLKDIRPDLCEEWERLFNMRGSEAAEVSRWVSAKFSDIGPHSALRAITTQISQSPLSIRTIYRQGKILLVRIPDTHMPSAAASLVGGLIFNRLFEEAQLAGVNPRPPFYIHVDEFQRFVSSDLEELVAEARKFYVGLTFAHQNLRQLEAFSAYEGTTNSRLADAIFSNVGTLITMKTAGRDVHRFAEELSLSDGDVRSVSRGHAMVRTGRAGDDVLCSVAIPLAAATARHATRQSIRARMIRKGYWLSREGQDRAADELLMTVRKVAMPVLAPAGTAQAAKSLGADVKPATGSFLEDWLTKRDKRDEEADLNTVVAEPRQNHAAATNHLLANHP